MARDLEWDVRKENNHRASTANIDYAYPKLDYVYMQAVLCTNRHAYLLGDIPFTRLYSTPIRELAPQLISRLESAREFDLFTDGEGLISLIEALCAQLGELSLVDIATRPLDDFSKEQLLLLANIRGTGIWVPTPTGDAQLRTARMEALKALISTAPELTIKTLYTAGHPDKSRDALESVVGAKNVGVLDVKGPPPAGGSNTLANSRVTFNTNDEDKDADTRVTIMVTDQNNTVAAYIDDYFGHFNDQSKYGPYEMEVRNPSTIDQMDRGSVTIQITPNGHDTWRFNMDLDLIFADGQHRSANSGNLQLTQNQNQAIFGLQGKLHP